MDKKSVYTKPKLKIHGNIENLTKGAGPGSAEQNTKRHVPSGVP